MRPDWSLESIKTKLKQLRRGAPDESRSLKRRRTSEVLAEIETAVNEAPRQTLSVLRRHSSLDMSRSTLWRALHDDLQARRFRPVRAPRLTAATRLARFNFSRDVLQRVGVLSVRGKRRVKLLDLTCVMFSDEEFFRWNHQGPAQNRPIWVVSAHGRPPRKARRVLRSDAGRRVLVTCMARLGTDTSSCWWQEANAASHTSRRTKAFLKEREIQLLTWLPFSPDLSPLDFHLWQAWETALGERQFTFQLELRAMIVRTMSGLDPKAAEKAGVRHWVHSQMPGVRARQRRAILSTACDDRLTCTRFCPQL